MDGFGRRGFLKGLLAGVAGTTALVKATPQEIAAFGSGVGTPVQLVEAPAPAQVPRSEEGLGRVYLQDGTFLGYVTQIDVRSDRWEQVPIGSGFWAARPGLIRSEIRVVGSGPGYLQLCNQRRIRS